MELRVNDMAGLMLYTGGFFFFEGGLSVVSLRMNASKKFCLSQLILLAVERSGGVVYWGLLVRDCPLSAWR